MLVFPDGNLDTWSGLGVWCPYFSPVRKYQLLMILGYRLMVGHQVLVLSIEVRVLVPQPKNRIAVFAKIRSVAKRRDGGFRQNSPRVFEIQKERAGREAGVLCSTNSQNSNFVSQSLSDNYQYLT